MNNYDRKLAGMDAKTAKAFGQHLNAAMGQKKPAAKKTAKPTKKKKG